MTKQPNFQKGQKPYGVIVDLDNMNGVQTARILSRHKIPIIAIARDPKHYGSKTRLCEKILFADTKSDKFIKTLERLGPKLGQKAVLFPCQDMSVLLISRHRRRLEKWYHVILPDSKVIEMMMDKLNFYTYALKKGFPIPRTFFLKSRRDAEKASQEIKFPCVLKPPVSATAEWEQNSPFKAYRVSSAEDLLEIYDRLHHLVEVLIVQEWVKGPNSNLYSCNCYFNSESEPVVTFIARKLRQWPPDTGESCLGEECRDDAVLNETVRLFRSLNYRGLGYVEMKKDERSGRYFIMEPNVGRPTGRSAIAEAGGVELIYAMYCDAVRFPLPVNLKQKYKGVKWIFIRRDCQSAWYHIRKGELTIGGWLRSLRGRKGYALFSWKDPGPFFFDIIRAINLFFSPEGRKKRPY
jgi:predicted ATP-grasp superfamily ATP-dependent carboligase